MILTTMQFIKKFVNGKCVNRWFDVSSPKGEGAISPPGINWKGHSSPGFHAFCFKFLQNCISILPLQCTVINLDAARHYWLILYFYLKTPFCKVASNLALKNIYSVNYRFRSPVFLKSWNGLLPCLKGNSAPLYQCKSNNQSKMNPIMQHNTNCMK